MKLLKLLGAVSVMALMSALMSVPANAFQETQITPATAVEGDAPTKALRNNGKDAASVELTTPSIDADASDGTEIIIPGLGSIGKLPKLDFGLELLYSADEKRDTVEASTAPEDKEPISDVMIRGTVKHRF